MSATSNTLLKNRLTLSRNDLGEIDIPTMQQAIQHLRHKDLFEWLKKIFPELSMPEPDNIPAFIALIHDGTLLCKLAQVVQPSSPNCPFPTPSTDEEKMQNISTFLETCNTLGLHATQLFTAEDLISLHLNHTASSSRNSSDAEIESRVTHALLIFGVLSNELNNTPIKLAVDDAVELEDRDRQLRSVRSGRMLSTPSAEITALEQSLGAPAELGRMGPPPSPTSAIKKQNKLSLKRMGKEKSVRFSLSSHKQARNQGPSLPGADSMTPEQLAEFNRITKNNFNTSTPPLTVPVPHIAAPDPRHASKLPPMIDRHRSLMLANSSPFSSPILQLDMACLASQVSASDITIRLQRTSNNTNAADLSSRNNESDLLFGFGTGDFVLCEDELMEVKGKMEDTLMVSRGVKGTTAVGHVGGATVTRVIKDFENCGEGDFQRYEVLRHRALEEDFDDFDEMDFLDLLEETHTATPSTFVYIISEKYNKQLNTDSNGRHNDDRLLAYLINRLELVATTKYSILYFHSADEEHQLDFRFLSRAFGVLSSNLKNNLQHVWVVHPTMWVKMAFFVCSPFLDHTVTTKVFVCETLKDLYQDFEEGGLPLPPAVLKADKDKKSSWF